ncbi:MAG: hypothetical protein CVU56_24975 [Deltaproteobacteria bacterium HGW-Deltaproteobacteria-14]|nr:MAG: hypothetical protein CVU56_24975 [Deltaproteobacteria bacterium HGW-Deltaproteobacteria-14]
MSFADQTAQLSPSGGSYAAGAAALAPVQLRGVGGGGGEPTKTDEGAGGGEKDKPHRVEGGTFQKVGGQLLFKGYGANNGAKDGETFLAVVDGKEFEVRIRSAFKFGSCEVFFGALPDWLWDPSKKPDEDKGAKPDAKPGAAGGRNPHEKGEHADATLKFAKVGAVKVADVPDLRDKGKEIGGEPFDFTLTVVLDGKPETHSVHAVGDQGGQRLAATLDQGVGDVLDSRVSPSDVARVTREVRAKLKPRLPSSWF